MALRMSWSQILQSFQEWLNYFIFTLHIWAIFKIDLLNKLSEFRFVCVHERCGLVMGVGQSKFALFFLKIKFNLLIVILSYIEILEYFSKALIDLAYLFLLEVVQLLIQLLLGHRHFKILASLQLAYLCLCPSLRIDFLFGLQRFRK